MIAKLTSKQTDQDDCETHKSTTDQHDRVCVSFGKGFVMDAHASDGQGLELRNIFLIVSMIMVKGVEIL